MRTRWSSKNATVVETLDLGYPYSECSKEIIATNVGELPHV